MSKRTDPSHIPTALHTVKAATLVAKFIAAGPHLASTDPKRLAAIMSRESEHVVLCCWCYADGGLRSAGRWYINRSWVAVLS